MIIKQNKFTILKYIYSLNIDMLLNINLWRWQKIDFISLKVFFNYITL